MEEKDVYIKDEGDFLTVCFQTPKAIETLTRQPKEIQDRLYGSDDYKKLDIDLGQEKQILLFAISHDLSIESETDIIV